jgi:restriction system protein
MPIPDYQTCMLPLLKFASDGKAHKLLEATAALSDQFHLTPEERGLLLPSGTQYIIANRVGWARTYLKKQDCLLTPSGHSSRSLIEGKIFLKKTPRRFQASFCDGTKSSMSSYKNPPPEPLKNKL